MYQKLGIIGNVGKDPESRFTPAGQQVTNFSVAVNESFTNSAGEKITRTLWFRVSAWGKQAEVMYNYVKKGMLVFVEGRLIADEKGNPRVWESNGTHGANFEINAQTVKFLSKVGAAEHQEEHPEQAEQEEAPF
jgi:single-strand DNA-binding protein